MTACRGDTVTDTQIQQEQDEQGTVTDEHAEVNPPETLGEGLSRLEYVLQEPDVLFAMVKRAIGLVIGISVVAVSMSFGMFYVQHERFLEVFISATLGWSGYLFAHYSATGKFIHQQQDQHLFPSSTRKILGGIAGILVLTAGITIWAISLQQGDRITGLLGSGVFLAGYIIAHYEFTGDLL